MKIKNLFFTCTLLLVVSCTLNHYHDGKYKGAVYDGGAWMNMHTEVLTINGNEILVEKYTLMGSAAGTTKVKCEQFADRIDVEDGNTTKVLTQTNDGSLRLNADVVYERIPDDSVITEKKFKPLIKKKGDRLIIQ